MPKLPYAHDALEPHISSETIDYHYGKHLKAYVDKLNGLIPGTPFEKATLEEIIKLAEGAVFNNGAQVWNHKFYFDAFSPKGQKAPEGELRDAIVGEFGSMENFRDAFEKAGMGQFGSGWVWLAKDAGGALKILVTPNAGNPMRDGLTPLLTMDVWEHAYYIDYRNGRADSLKATWNVIDWSVVEERYAK
jgi:Fe-Mn family superoxide dismutase